MMHSPSFTLRKPFAFFLTPGEWDEVKPFWRIRSAAVSEKRLLLSFDLGLGFDLCDSCFCYAEMSEPALFCVLWLRWSLSQSFFASFNLYLFMIYNCGKGEKKSYMFFFFFAVSHGSLRYFLCVLSEKMPYCHRSPPLSVCCQRLHVVLKRGGQVETHCSSLCCRWSEILLLQSKVKTTIPFLLIKHKFSTWGQSIIFI